ncbi:MAG TPA: HemK2/MTQ2 family protein methyltransferase [Methylomirabilota bacterium]
MTTADDAGVLLYVWRGWVFRVAEAVQPPKAGSLFFVRNLPVRSGERVLEIGCGLGLAAVMAAKAGATVVATDVVSAAVEATRLNAVVNGVTVDARVGDCYAPVAGERFHLVCSNPPQMPTPPGRARTDAVAAADNGGVDGWEILDRVIDGAAAHLHRGGRLVFTIFGFLGKKRALARLEQCGFQPAVVATEVQAFPRIGYERLDHLRALDHEGTLGARGLPQTVERVMVQGTLVQGTL